MAHWSKQFFLLLDGARQQDARSTTVQTFPNEWRFTLAQSLFPRCQFRALERAGKDRPCQEHADDLMLFRSLHQQAKVMR